MELVAASKMRKAVSSAQQLRQYALGAYAILEKIAEGLPGEHPFLEKRPTGKVLVVVLSSDRGLCGSLNAHLLRSVSKYVEQVKTLSTFETLEFVAVGRKAQQYLARMKLNVVAAFPGLSNHPRFRDILPITRLVLDNFQAGQYDHVVLAYNDFVSPLVQEPTVKVLLPFSQTDMKSMLASLNQTKHKDEAPEIKRTVATSTYVFEPSPEIVLTTIMPQLTEIQLYQAILESAASEHSARMLAMHNATENAESILDDLTLTYNQTRQANITAELAELSSAAAVLG